jgi:hypothetical protein
MTTLAQALVDFMLVVAVLAEVLAFGTKAARRPAVHVRLQSEETNPCLREVLWPRRPLTVQAASSRCPSTAF